MKLIAHIPSHVEMRLVTDFLRSIGLEVRYKDCCLLAQSPGSRANVIPINRSRPTSTGPEVA